VYVQTHDDVDVQSSLPNSSISSSDRGVACLSMCDTCAMSIVNELCGSEQLSTVSMRVKMRSVSPMIAFSHGR
jgi:hypothetical protein